MGKYTKTPTPQEKRKQKLLLISGVALLAAAALLLIFLIAPKENAASSAVPFIPQIDEGADAWKGLPTEPTEAKAPAAGIAIPGYPTIKIPAGTAEVSLPLHNPEGNPCYFTFTLVLEETGETLYESKQVPPGQGIAKVTLRRALEKGEHPAVIQIRTNALDDGRAMNGANMVTTLVAQ